MMLEKWQQTATVLLTKGDILTPVIFVRDSNNANNPSEKLEFENVMKRTLNNNISSFIRKDECSKISLYAAKDGIYDIYQDRFFGNTFINFYWQEICDCDGFKLQITRIDGKQLTLVIIKK